MGPSHMCPNEPEDLLFLFFNSGTGYHGGTRRNARRFHGKRDSFLSPGRIPRGSFKERHFAVFPPFKRRVPAADGSSEQVLRSLRSHQDDRDN